MLPQKFDIEQYISILRRRTWYIVTPFFVIVLAGVIYALVAPRMYQATTLILVERQKVPENYVKSTVTDTLQDRINTINQQVTSRTNMESLINEYGLYARENHSEREMLMQDKVELMRRRIRVQVTRGAAFSISFMDGEPQKAMQVTTALARNFIHEHAKVREEQSIGTTMFLEDELVHIEKLLQEREAALTAYKQAHMKSLPDQLQTNLALLGQLRQKTESIERSIDETRSQRIMLQGQISSLESLSGGPALDSLVDIDPQADPMAPAPEVQELEDRLENLLLRYTENHPDVIKLKKMIAKMERDKKEDTSPSGEQTTGRVDMLPGGDSFFSAQIEALKGQLTSINLTIKDLEAQKAKLEFESSRLAKVIEETPKRQMDLVSLQRDYDTIKNQYDSLLAKKLDSQLASNMEKRQQGEQFRIIDPAKLPEKPVKPNKKRILLLALLAGLALGCGLVLGMEHLDQSFRDYDELGEFLQLPVLAVIPRITTPDDIRKQKRFRVFAYCLSGSILVLVVIGIWLWADYSVDELVEKIRTLV